MSQACLKKYFKTFVLIFLLFFVFLPKTNAQSSLGLTATPVRIGDDGSLSLDPGEKKQVQLKVKNSSKDDVALESRVADFIIGDDGRTPVVVNDAENERWALSSWVTLAPAYNELVAGGSAVVNALIEVPEDAMPGGHYAMVYHQPAIAAEPDQTGAGVSQRVASLLYVIVKGPINQEAYISALKMPGFLENGPVDISLTVNNQSDVHISPEPVLKVYNLFGKEVASFKAEKKNIFPLTEREFSAQWGKVWGFGRYLVKAEAAYGDQGQVAVAEAAIWLIPVKIIIAGLIVILIIFAVIVALKKKAQPVIVEDKEGENEQAENQETDQS